MTDADNASKDSKESGDKFAEQNAEIIAQSVSSRIAERFGVDVKKLIQTLKQTAFRQSGNQQVTDVQMMALMVVADQYGLNPFTNEIYAFPAKGGGIVPVVGVDGWSRIANQHPQYDGVEFYYSDVWAVPIGGKSCPEWIECRITRKDRSKPIVIREYLDECYQSPKLKESQFEGGQPYYVSGPWQSTTKRQLRHKSFVQCCRVALSFSGIYDQDEAERIIAGEVVTIAGSDDIQFPESVIITGSENAEIVAPLQLTIEAKEEIDNVLKELISRSLNMKSFAPATQFVNARYTGPMLEYAIQCLREAEIDHMPPPSIYLQSELDNVVEAIDSTLSSLSVESQAA